MLFVFVVSDWMIGMKFGNIGTWKGTTEKILLGVDFCCDFVVCKLLVTIYASQCIEFGSNLLKFESDPITKKKSESVICRSF